MFLSNVRLVTHTKDRQLAGRLMHSWTHVEDILRGFLPPRWAVGGIGSLIIILELEIPVRHEWLVSSGSGELRWKDFDATAFLDLPDETQELQALSMMESGLRIACARAGVSDVAVAEAIEKTRATGFRQQWSSRKLAKWNRTRSVRGEVLVTFRRGGTDVALRLTRRDGEVVHDEPVATGQYWPSVWFDFFKSRWEGSDFVVDNRIGKETIRRAVAR